MLESFALVLYVDENPSSAKRFYANQDWLADQSDAPSMKTLVQDIQGHKELQTRHGRDTLNWLYRSWWLMSKGVHPSGAGIRQTEMDRGGRFAFGATHHAELCLVGFDHGLFAVALLLPFALKAVRPQDEVWQVAWAQLRSDVGAWRAARMAEIAAAEGELPPDPPDTPDPTMEDVRRARRTIQLWEANANAWKGPLPAVRP